MGRKYPPSPRKLVATNPNLTAAERGLVQQSNREKLMSRLSGDMMVEKIADILENPDSDKYSSAERSLALKIASSMVFGEAGQEGAKNPTSAVQINITGIGARDSKDIKDDGDFDPTTAVTINQKPVGGSDDAS